MIRHELRLLVLLLPFALLSGCTRGTEQTHGYQVNKDGVYWAGMPVSGADPLTFEWLEENGEKLPWGRDANRGYFRNLPVPNSHGLTFEAFVENKAIAKDKNHVYYGRHNIEQTKWFSNADAEWRINMRQPARSIRIIQEADAASFRYRDGSFFVDDHHIFRGHKLIENADPETFRHLDISSRTSSSWFADRNHVFRKGSILKHADPASFRVDPDTGDMMDDEFVYYSLQRYEVKADDGTVIPARSESWRTLGNEFYRTDGNYVFQRRGPVLPDADPASFEVVGKGYIKDRNHVWFGDVEIEDADPSSFDINEDGIAYDSSGLFLGDRDPRNKKRHSVK